MHKDHLQEYLWFAWLYTDISSDLKINYNNKKGRLWALLSKQSYAQARAAIMKSWKTSKVFKMHWFTKLKRLRGKTYLWMKICSMGRGYKYLTFVVVLAYVLNLRNVNFRKVFFSSSLGKPRLVTLWQWQEWCHQQKISLFFKGLFRFWQTGVGKLLQQILPALSSAVLIP